MATTAAGETGGDEEPTLISGAALSKEITAALKAAGFDWVQGVALKRRARAPNWSIVRLIGRPPAGTDYQRALKHPLVADLQKKFVLT